MACRGAAKISGVSIVGSLLIDFAQPDNGADKSFLTFEQLINGGAELMSCFVEMEMELGTGRVRPKLRQPEIATLPPV